MVETVSCDLCGATDSAPMYTLQDNSYNIPGEFVLQRCLSCGLMYLSPRPTPDAIASYYPREYAPYRTAIEDEPWTLMRWMRRRKLAKRHAVIEKYSGKNRGRLLDVGCATGLFLHEMAQVGWEAHGVELTASAAEYAQRRFGLYVYRGVLKDAPYPTHFFDVVTFWDVLEHTYSPSQELAHGARLLRPGGLLVLSVPNWSSLDRRLFGKYWLGVDAPRHLYVFTQETLTALLAQAGFSVLDRVCFISGYFSFAMSLEQRLKSVSPRLGRLVRQIYSLPGMRLPFEPWFALSNWLKRGAIISVLARKNSV